MATKKVVLRVKVGDYIEVITDEYKYIPTAMKGCEGVIEAVYVNNGNGLGFKSSDDNKNIDTVDVNFSGEKRGRWYLFAHHFRVKERITEDEKKSAIQFPDHDQLNKFFKI